jgi:hypothetical protein
MLEVECSMLDVHLFLIAVTPGTPPYNAKLITHHITSVAGIPNIIRLKSSNFGLNFFFAVLATNIQTPNQAITGKIFVKK